MSYSTDPEFEFNEDQEVRMPLPYELEGADPGHLCEVYLPKKSKYQGLLYKTLVKGLEFDALKRHFAVDNERADQIRHFVRNRGFEIKPEYVNSLKGVFMGYSLYEVDGVFASSGSPQALYEERTQVIRFIFVPDFEGAGKACDCESFIVRELAKIVFRIPAIHMGEIVDRVRGSTGVEIPHETIRKSIDWLIRWECSTSLFLYGFVVYSISRDLRELNLQDPSAGAEEEIWTTISPSMSVIRSRLSRIT
ncbi:MAG: hypothetical protein H6818_08635 [Phycisphaerales bacterium]|nr:hypothetical protein [Phycisphaerales bacterium]MCB9862636.1 hypothetical protein [Phycisphaerales bacterium]